MRTNTSFAASTIVAFLSASAFAGEAVVPAAPAPGPPPAAAPTAQPPAATVPPPAPAASTVAPPPAAPPQAPAASSPPPPSAARSTSDSGVILATSSSDGSTDPEGDFERRLVVFTDGGSPRLVSFGDHAVRGPLELEVRFRNANPLCYEYSTNIAASHIAASDLPLPERVPGIGAFGAMTITNFSTLEDALSAVNNAQTDLDDILNAARIQVSLDDVWAGCDGGVDFGVERGRVETAARVAAERLGTGGSWRQALESAEAVSLGAKRLSREMETGEHEAAQDVDAKKTALTDATRKESEAREQAARTGHTKKVQADLDDAARELAAAQRRLREAENALARHRRAGDLGHAAERLGERVHHTLDSLSASVADINRARALLARSPTAIRRRFGAGEKVSVVVERTRLDRGEKVSGRGPQLFEVAPYRTLRPIILDLGFGPALGIGHNTAKYQTVFAPRDETDKYPAWRVVRTEEGLPLDAMISLSAYIWQRRYLDDVVVDPMAFIPRPMIGVSLAHPLTEFYAGGQIDPIQFLDISGGVRFANEDVLIGPQQLDRALVDANGKAQPPVVRRELRPSGFVAVTISTNLLYSWIKQGL